MSKPKLEEAVELVVAWLTDHGHHELAHGVAVATDPRTPAQKARLVKAVKKARRK